MQPSDPRTPLSLGISWASRVTTLGLEFALPAFGGYWVDGRLGTRPWGTLAGTCLGFAIGILHLIRIAREGSSGGQRPPGRP